MDLNEKEIRGVNIKQIIAYTVIISALFGGWFSIRYEIQQNREQTIITREMIKEDRELRKLEIQSLKQDMRLNLDLQRESQMRLNLLEYQMKKIDK